MNYKVKIPKKFKDKLSKRFDFKKARQVKFSLRGSRLRGIMVGCTLCFTFYLPGGKCEACPFKKFETKKDHGCFRWIKKVLPQRRFHMTEGIWWEESEDNEVKEQLSLLRKKAKELIEWV